MHLLGPWLLLLVSECLAFSDSHKWSFYHPHTVYAWEGACVWISCKYTTPKSEDLENVTVYHNAEYSSVTKSYSGTILYRTTKIGEPPSQQERVRFLGGTKNNCSLSISRAHVNDSGRLGLRMMSKTDRWMEEIHLNVSERPLVPRIRLPPEIRESQEATLTCWLNFTCFGYRTQWQWSLEEEPADPSTSTTATTDLIQSELKFQPQWRHHGKNVTCQLWSDREQRVLSEETVRLDVKHAPKNVTAVIQNPTPIREGDRVTVSCNYNSSNPRVTRYQWSHRGSWGQQSPGLLVIQKVAWDDKTVTCAACNSWCSWAPPVNLNVHYAPRDVRVLQTNPRPEIHSGHPVVLQCDFSSSRPGEVRFIWKKNGSFLGEGRELSFNSVSPEDAGNYSCSVSNSIGQTASEAWGLQVLYAPRRLRVSMAPGDSVMEGEKAALTCESDANPPVSQYSWFDWNNQNLRHAGRTLRLDPAKVEHSGAYWCRGASRLGVGESPPSTLTVYYSPETIGRRAAVVLGLCLALLILVIFGVKFWRNWKRSQSQQGLQENSSGQSFFVRNKKMRRTPLSEGSHAMGCCNPVMEDGISYAALRFPETDTPGTGDAGSSGMQGLRQDGSDAVTYSVVQKRRVGDYENVAPNSPEDEGIHYSELIQFGAGERPRVREDVEYVTLKH
ncbi:PREDICTED: B-cell receptor CD22 isoform X4 [Propithecus coquereli]|uniref:B-cell receptor CD22 isoform X4 n=1 Tax=Propithecus coquereli TaxID=379532 RepID=UPI00063EF973|nr:PREDICTED: B-cell receptor CD22 isoform X4 [Propithecus coquereli]